MHRLATIHKCDTLQTDDRHVNSSVVS